MDLHTAENTTRFRMGTVLRGQYRVTSTYVSIGMVFQAVVPEE